MKASAKKRNRARAGCAAAADVRSLAAFVKTHPRRTGGIQCFTCSMAKEVRDQINRAQAEGVPVSTIWSWMTTQGYKGTVEAVGKHFRHGHHKREAR